MGKRRGSTLIILAIAVSLAGSAWATQPSPKTVPGVGTVAPAFGLYALGKKVRKEDKKESREAIQLDSYCGLRPGETKAVLVTFVDSKGKLLSDDVLSTWYRKHHRAGLEIVAISTEKNPAQFSSEIRRARFKFPVLDDRHGVVAYRYGVNQAPFTFLLDEECRILGFNAKEAADEAEGLNRSIEALLHGEGSAPPVKD